MYSATQSGRVFLGNQYVKTFSLSKAGGLLGKASLFAGVGMDAIGVWNYYKLGADNPNSVSPAKFGLNTSVGVYGLWNPASILYFGIDAFYSGGWNGAANNYESLQRENSRITPGFITAPYGALKF